MKDFRWGGIGIEADSQLAALPGGDRRSFGGRSDVFAGSERSQVSYIGRLRGYRDLTEGTNIDFVGSFAFGHTDVEPDATRRLVGVDATFRNRPLRRRSTGGSSRAARWSGTRTGSSRPGQPCSGCT